MDSTIATTWSRAAGTEVTIDRPLVEMRRNASETENYTQEYDLVAR